MRNLILIFLLVCASSLTFSQSKNKGTIKMTAQFSSSNQEIRDYLNYEGVEYLKLNFKADDLADKSYTLSVKEIWDGEIKSDSVIINSAEFGIDFLEKINDTSFELRIISKLSDENKLKMTFNFPHFSTTVNFDAIDSEDYSLRNVVENNGSDIKYGEKFYLLAYILPYEKDGNKYWCAVDSSGKDIESWGKEFGIKHYLVFEMKFE